MTAKRLCFLLSALVLIVSLAVPAMAQEAPDLTKTGSISLTMTYQGKPVGGGNMSLYRVGEIVEEDGSYSFALNDSFAPSGVSVADPTDREAARQLEDFARKNGIGRSIRVIQDDGTVIFEKLKPGLYLLSQDRPPKGYNPVDPFLVSVPMSVEGHYVYEVDAAPKVSLTPAPTVPPTKPTYPSTSIPQTGQNVLPILVLGAAGMAMLCAGWVTSRKKGK